MSKKDNIPNKEAVSASRPLNCSTAVFGNAERATLAIYYFRDNDTGETVNFVMHGQSPPPKYRDWFCFQIVYQ